MTEQRNQLADLFAACWKDEALKARFVNDPKTVLAEYGLEYPAGLSAAADANADARSKAAAAASVMARAQVGARRQAAGVLVASSHSS